MMSAYATNNNKNDACFTAAVFGLAAKGLKEEDARYTCAAAALVLGGVLYDACTDFTVVEEEGNDENDVPFVDAVEGDEWDQYEEAEEFVHNGMGPLELTCIEEEVPGVLRFHPQVVTEIYELDMSEEAVQYRKEGKRLYKEARAQEAWEAQLLTKANIESLETIEEERTLRFDPQVVTEIYDLDMSSEAVQYRKEGVQLYKKARAQEAWEEQLLTKANIDCLETIEEEVWEEAAFANDEEGPMDMDIDEEYECLDVLPPAPPAPRKPIQAPQGPAIQVSKFVLPTTTRAIVPIATTAYNLDDFLPEPCTVVPICKFPLHFQVPYHHGAIVPYQSRAIVEYNSDRALIVVADNTTRSDNSERAIVAYNTEFTMEEEEEQFAGFDDNKDDPIGNNNDNDDGVDDTDPIPTRPRASRKKAAKKKPRVASRKQPSRACKKKKAAAKSQSRTQPPRACKKQPAQRRQQPARRAKTANPFGS